jgi:hypothetical protein
VGFWDQQKVLRQIQRLRKNNLPLYAKYVMKIMASCFPQPYGNSALGKRRCSLLA